MRSHAIDQTTTLAAEAVRHTDDEAQPSRSKLYVRRRFFAADEPSHIHVQRPSARTAERPAA